ncbi:NDP-sugar synthase [bacterium]|nr:NDP-sugar synthase [bacterium]
MKGVILAAGKGTRMLPLTQRRPKPLVPVLDRPMIDHIILGARDAGVDHLALVIDYMGEMIQERYGDGSALGLRIDYIWQEGARGTGAATLLAADFVGDEPFFLSWGDIIVAPETYANVLRVWHEEQPAAILSLNWVPDPWEGAAVYVDEAGYIERIVEKPPKGSSTTHYNNAGIFMLGPDVFEVLRQCPISPRGEVEFPDAIKAMMAQQRRIRGLEVIGYWSDVARPSAVLDLNSTIVNHRSSDGIIISPGAQVDPAATLMAPVFIGRGCRVGAATLGPEVTLGADTLVGDGAVLRRVATFGGNRLGEGCHLENVVVEERVALGGVSLSGTAETPEAIPTPGHPG